MMDMIFQTFIFMFYYMILACFWLFLSLGTGTCDNSSGKDKEARHGNR